MQSQTAQICENLDPEQAPIETVFGVLGMPCFTAYAELRNIGKPKAR